MWRYDHRSSVSSKNIGLFGYYVQGIRIRDHGLHGLAHNIFHHTPCRIAFSYTRTDQYGIRPLHGIPCTLLRFIFVAIAHKHCLRNSYSCYLLVVDMCVYLHKPCSHPVCSLRRKCHGTGHVSASSYHRKLSICSLI